MKLKNRLTALFLAAALAVSGVPSIPAGADEVTLPDTRMRFVQTNFDTSAGVLTMALQVKREDGVTSKKDTGAMISSGFFAFQVNAASLTPITRPTSGDAVPIMPTVGGGKHIAVVTGDSSAAMTSFLGSSSVMQIAGGQNINTVMGTTELMPAGTALMVSDERYRAGQSSMLDCYFQFRTINAGGLAGADGYYTVINLDFLASSNNENILYSGSIHLPENQAEADDILQRFPYQEYNYYSNPTGAQTRLEGLKAAGTYGPVFYDAGTQAEYDTVTAKKATYTDSADPDYDENYANLRATYSESNAGHTTIVVSMGLGGAGFIEKSNTTGTLYPEDGGRYYFRSPESTSWWRGVTNRTTWTTAKAATNVSMISDVPATATDTQPGLYYKNMNSDFILTGLLAGIQNTYTGMQGVAAEDADFNLPTNVVGNPTEGFDGPRYVIPTYTKAQEIIQNNGTWVPERWREGTKGSSGPMQIKYYLTTQLAGSAATNPEKIALDASNNQNLNAFMQGFQWDFSLEDGTPLSEYLASSIVLADGQTLEEYLTAEGVLTGGKTLEQFLNETYPDPDVTDKLGAYLQDEGKRFVLTESTTEQQLTVKAPDWENGTSTDKKVYVRDLTITEVAAGENQNLVDGVFWKVYEDTEYTEYTITPYGVLLDYLTGSVTYMAPTGAAGEMEEATNTNTLTPQLHVTTDAANRSSYFWKLDPNSSHSKVYLEPTYTYNGESYSARTPYIIRLYGEAPTPTSIEIEPGDLPVDETDNSKSYFWVGKSDLKGTTEGDTLEDAIAGGTVLVYATMFDQYHTPYEPTDSDHPILTLVPDAETLARINANSSHYAEAFTINWTPNVEDRNQISLDGSRTLDPQNAYTIIYNTATYTTATGDTRTEVLNANAVETGTYVLKAEYTAPGVSLEPSTRTVTISRTDDYMAYIRTSVDAQNASASEPTATNLTDREANLVLSVPTSTVTTVSGATVVVSSSVEAAITLQELANQWRPFRQTEVAPGEFEELIPQNMEDFDIAPAARTSTGISLRALRDLGYDVSFQILPEGAVSENDIRLGRIDVSRLEQEGIFTYTNKMPNGKTFDIEMTVTEPEIPGSTEERRTARMTYHLTFTREQSYLQRISIRSVPTITAEPNTAAANTTITALPFNQYDTEWRWTGSDSASVTYAPGTRRNPSSQAFDYRIRLVNGSTLPDGVTLTGTHNEIISTAAGAKAGTFQVYAEYGPAGGDALAVSDPVTVTVVRRPSVATTIDRFRYFRLNGTTLATSPTYEITSPFLNPLGDALVYKPDGTRDSTKYIVYDQYSEPISDAVITFPAVEFTVTSTDSNFTDAQAASYIHLDDDGTLTVDPGATPCTVSIMIEAERNGVASTTTTLTVKRREPAETVEGSVEVHTPKRASDGENNDEKFIWYPTRDETGSAAQRPLTATGQTQYSPVGETVTLGSSEVSWFLDKVVLSDDSVLEGNSISSIGSSFTAGVVNMSKAGVLSFTGTTDTSQLPKTITVTAEAASGASKQETITVKYDDPEGREIILNNNANLALDRPDENQYSAYQTVDASVRDQFGIIRDWEVTWVLKDMTVEEAAAQGFQVNLGAAAGTSPNVVPAHSVRASWRAAYRSSIVLMATYTDPNTDRELEPKEVTIRVSAVDERDWTVGALEILSLANQTETRAFTVDDVPQTVTIPLPSEEEATVVYTLNRMLKNQSGDEWNERGVTWSIAGAEIDGTALSAADTAKLATIEAPTSYQRQLHVKYYKTAAEALNESTPKTVKITVQVESTDNDRNGNKVTDQKDIYFELESQRTPTYATVTMTRGDRVYALYDDGRGFRPVIPERNADPNQIDLQATVYDQYGLELTDSQATISLSAPEQYVSISATTSDNKAVLYVQSQQVATEVNVVAYPEGHPERVHSESTYQVQLSKGPDYPYSLELYDRDNEYKNVYRYEIPRLGGDATANVLPEDVWTTDYTLRAELRTQRDAWMQTRANNGTRPVWELAGTYTGVKFPETMDVTVRSEAVAANPSKATSVVTGTDANGDPVVDFVKSETISLAVSNRAVPAGQTEQTVTFDLHLTDSTGAVFGANDPTNFTKTQDVVLWRRAPVDTYLMITGVADDADGNAVATTAVDRPPLNADGSQGKSTYTVGATVYDQYGFPMEEIALGGDPASNITVQLDEERLRDLLDESGVALGDVLVENVYPSGVTVDENGLDEEGNPVEPIGYKIWHVEYGEPGVDEETGDPLEPEIASKKLMAELTRANGELDVYTDCDLLTEIPLAVTYKTANSHLNGAGTKKVIVPVSVEKPYPASVEMDPAAVSITLEPDAEEPVAQYITPTVYDQYGVRFTGAIMNWKLFHAADENGSYPDYDEYEEVLPDEDDEDAEPQTRKRALEEQALRLSGSSSSGATVTVNPAQFQEPITAVARCVTLDTSGNQVATYINIQVVRKASAPPFNGFVSDVLLVSFDAGEYGKLVGPSTVEVIPGEAVVSPPGVKTVTGYGFIGWTADGETLVDVTQIPVNEEITYYAVYRDVAQGEFLEGYPDGTIRPNANVTRGEFMTMVIRAIGGYDPNVDYGSSFSDVAPGMWYSGYIAFAKVQGIAAGYPDGTFKPEQAITRAEAARLLAVAAGLSLDTDDNFRDIQDGKWYTGSVGALKESGAASGYPDGTYRPFQNITRAEAVKLVVSLTNNALDDIQKANIVECAYCPFTDISKGNWAYAYILRAAGIA